MAKFMVVSHRSEAAELLEAIQREGICQILNAEQAMVSKDWPDLSRGGERPRDVEELLNRLTKCLEFLKGFSKLSGGFASFLAPRIVINERTYGQVVSDKDVIGLVEQAEQTQSTIDKLKTDLENLTVRLEELSPWQNLQTPVENLGQLKYTVCWAGLVPSQRLEQLQEDIAKLGAAIQQVGTTAGKYACVIVCMKDTAEQMQKLLRSAEFEQANFSGITGTVAATLESISSKLSDTKEQLDKQYNKASHLAENLPKVQILNDHYANLLTREQTKETAPATERTVIFEGWVKARNYNRLEKMVSGFKASSLKEVEPAQGEEIPVEIENSRFIRPFEVITRLYGMPQVVDVDPTVFIAPFFALFFGICLGDAGYGLVVIAAMALLIKKMQGDTKLLWMLGICSGAAVVFGALTGGWFGDAVEQFIPAIAPLKNKIVLFDPLAKPEILLGLSVTLGYIHIMTGLLIAFGHNLRRKDFIAAVCDQLTWLVMLNSIVILGLSKAGVVPAGIGSFCGKLAIIPAAMIFLFSNRQGGWGGRLGMGFYNLFSSVFYMGDVLSYLRLMGLCMVGAGMGMAINLIAKLALNMPYVGVLIAILIFIGGHGFNLVLSALGAFVHTMRLQYVEFFPKFFAGGGKVFVPLSKEYKHICLKD